MTKIFPTDVNPGDLIEAKLINDIMHAIDDLKDRVKELENVGTISNAPYITGLFPCCSLHLGDKLTVLGMNFDYSIGGHRVYIDGIRVKSFGADSSDEKLIFEIPDKISDVTEEGKSVPLTVRNSISSASIDIVVFPKQIPLGGIVEVSYKSVTPQKLAVGEPAVFRYYVKSGANQTATFEIKADISGVSNKEEWQNRLKVFDDTDNEISDRKIQLVPLEDNFFKIKITSIPSVPPNNSFTLTVGAVAPGVNSKEDSRVFPLKSTIDPQDENITLNFSYSDPWNAVENKTIKLEGSKSAYIYIEAELTSAGSYKASGKILSGDGWKVYIDPNAKDTYTVKKGESDTVRYDYIVEAEQNASKDGRVAFIVTRVGTNGRSTEEMGLIKI